MEKIRIGRKKKSYEIRSIMPARENILKIVFPEGGEIPGSWGGNILLYTAGGVHCSTLRGYETVYLQADQTVYLSNDGSVYVPPEPPEPEPEPEPLPEPEPYVPTLDEVREAKRAEISGACEQAIYTGVNVVLTNGELYHFSLTEKDQLNLFGKQIQLAAGAEKVEYHADGQPCRYYSAADMENIIGTAMWYVSYHTTYCNALNMWLAGCQTAEEVQEIFYGAEVPEEYRSEVLNAYLIQIAGMAGEEKSNETDA